jgi:hypothetical protein
MQGPTACRAGQVYDRFAEATLVHGPIMVPSSNDRFVKYGLETSSWI